jgi:hypothetical protein
MHNIHAAIWRMQELTGLNFPTTVGIYLAVAAIMIRKLLCVWRTAFLHAEMAAQAQAVVQMEDSLLLGTVRARARVLCQSAQVLPALADAEAPTWGLPA